MLLSLSCGCVSETIVRELDFGAVIKIAPGQAAPRRDREPVFIDRIA
jgi:hypothetical protein